MENKLVYSGSPHIKKSMTTRKIMLNVLIALIPATIMGVIFFGLRALLWVVLTTLSAVIFEFLYNYVVNKKNLKTSLKEFDLTSVVTGLLLALNLSVCVEWYVGILGSAFAVIVVKMLFGGTGKNLFNPAIAGRIFLLMSFTSMTQFVEVNGFFGSMTIMSGATPLTQMLTKGVATDLPLIDMFIGNMPGTIGETSALALLIGGIYLSLRKIIRWEMPTMMIVACGLVSVMLYDFDFNMFLPSILTGGLFLGAIFMATDYVTSPNTRLGNYIYFITLGALCALLRWYKSAECVSYAIMIMNMTVPLFDRYIVNKPFGYEKSNSASKN